ncbi:M24 family metallopeptidase [Allomesorhizobium alhagi]|jgi:Xaa-Pro dipeptidase|uniref:Peptidase M24 n=1 Tax=Mesorhizobium alhagi CCNWXJ12-2 TaxID=1107882 RepID=H0I152_9HYPH|nr:Xaa-Pro peptidase family protein [Mesorhizobium alhagi]EHK53299.1 peptidase M24 [Mesorhizobium alhagi CCNWXJ12-2]
MLLNEGRLRHWMEKLRLDAVIATAPENVTYMSGFWALPQWIRRGPQTYVVWPAQQIAEPEIITSTSTLDLIADQSPWVKRVRRYGDFHVVVGGDAADHAVSRQHAALNELPGHLDALAALTSALQEAGLAHANIGLDESGLLPGHKAALSAQLPKVQWTSAAALFRSVRAVKTDEEVERLAKVARIAERSIKAALAAAREGASERDLARAFDIETVMGGGAPVLSCIGFGERSALMNVQPSNRALQPGDVIRFDVGGRYRHYRADIARIATFGEPPPEVRRYHQALLRGVQYACEAIQPGMPTAKLFEEVVAVVRREGIPHYRRDHVGHGIGLDGYDAPTLSAGSTEVFEEGMVLCLETPYYEIGRWGLQVEDMVVVRRGGVERLMATDGDLIEVAR